VDYYGTHTGHALGSTTSNTHGDLPSKTRFCPITTCYPGGGDNVQAPVPTRVEPIATVSQGAASCPTNQHGWNRNVTNQLQDQFGGGYRHSGIQMADTISIGSTNQLGITGTRTGSAFTDSNGSWPDTYFVCSPACPSSGETIAGQSWTYNGTGLPHTNTVVYKCTSITVDSF
jgi:hypothetical protein